MSNRNRADQYKYSTTDVYEMYNIKRIGYVDIENDNLHPEFGHVLTIALLIRDVTSRDKVLEVKKYRVTQQEIWDSIKTRKVDFDRRIVKAFFDDLKKYEIDLLIGHYAIGWNKHDLPFLRSRALLMKMEDILPKYRAIKYGDTWKMAHTTIKVHSYRLDSIGVVTQAASKKTRIEELEWQLAKYGDKKGLDYVMDHNIKDVWLTYQVHKKIERFAAIPSTYV